MISEDTFLKEEDDDERESEDSGEDDGDADEVSKNMRKKGTRRKRI